MTEACCIVGRRPDVKEIDAALLKTGEDGAESLSALAARIGINKGSLHRHQQHLATGVAVAGEQSVQRDATTNVSTEHLETNAETGGGRVSSRGRGRPTDLTPALQEAIAKSIRNGCTLTDAAALNGIDDSTLQRWKARGASGEKPYCNFSEAITRARAAAKRKAIREVRRGVMMNGAKDWKAWAWWLERMYPNEFGAQAAVHVKVEQELASALDRLKERLAPDLYVMVLGALAEEAGGSTATVGEKGSRANQPN